MNLMAGTFARLILFVLALALTEEPGAEPETQEATETETTTEAETEPTVESLPEPPAVVPDPAEGTESADPVVEPTAADEGEPSS